MPQGLGVRLGVEERKGNQFSLVQDLSWSSTTSLLNLLIMERLGELEFGEYREPVWVLLDIIGNDLKSDDDALRPKIAAIEAERAF